MLAVPDGWDGVRGWVGSTGSTGLDGGRSEPSGREQPGQPGFCVRALYVPSRLRRSQQPEPTYTWGGGHPRLPTAQWAHSGALGWWPPAHANRTPNLHVAA